MEQIHIQRLERLHALALEIHADAERRKHFDLRGWATQYSREFCELLDMQGHSDALVHKADGCVALKEGACGTAACMIGWAGMDPEFNAQGFCLAIKGGYVNPVNHATGLSAWEAVTSFFGLTKGRAEGLFSSDAYGLDAGPLAVAERIQELLESVRAVEA